MEGAKKSRFRVSLAAVAAAALIVSILWFVGWFETGRIRPGREPAPEGVAPPQVQLQIVREARPAYYIAVGTVRSRTNTTVSAQTGGRVTAVRVDAGTPVEAGALLATLDGREQSARVAQAASNLEAARAELADAEIHHGRMERLLPENAVTPAQLDQARARLRQARANAEAAGKKFEEAEIIEGYTRIRAPMNGVIARRQVDPGDLAWPGKPLFVIHSPEGLRLEANVREGMIGRVEIGRPASVEISSLSRSVEGTVEEIVPSADPVSRSFLVKISLPAMEGLYPGMYGELKVALDGRPTILIPQEAVSDVGQMKTVLVRQNGRWIRRYVTLGERTEGRVEVLSGLSGGETIGWTRADADPQEDLQAHREEGA